MIKKYQYGQPIPTEAVVESVEIDEGVNSNYSISLETGFVFQMSLKEDDIVYGLGEANRGINKRGYRYESFCSDEPCHTESKFSLYGAHNFIVIDSEQPVGFFFDYPGKVIFDIGYEMYNLLSVTTEDANLFLYIITGNSAYDIVKQFRTLIGKSYLPPFWAFGYQQSRWGYQNKQDIKEVVSGYDKADMPLDAVYLDIDYMNNFKDFSVDESKFPQFPDFITDMKKQGIRLVPIIDAGVKIEEGYNVYEEGLEKDYFCKDENGDPFLVGVWPGDTYLPDFLNKEAAKWFGNQYKVLLDAGIEGFWNDMNEPAIFYSKQGIDKGFAIVEELKEQKLSVSNFWKLQGAFGNVSNSEEDYGRFYHHYNGQMIRHDSVHNLYGYFMTRAAQEAFQRLVPEKRILIFSRSSYIGMHRYGGIWTGDNHSWWSHLLLNIKMMPSLNMCGFLYSGADLGGFGGDTTEDLLLRWIAFGIFTPLMRNHSALGTRQQELYHYQHQNAFRSFLKLRYRMIPYLYSEFCKAVNNNEMLFRPLAFDYPKDKIARHVEDQLMFGEGLMLTPVYEQNAIGRYVYLPEDMTMLRFYSDTRYEITEMSQGHHFIEIALSQLVIFLKHGHTLVLGKPVNRTKDISYEELEYIGTPDAKYTLIYEDDGITSSFNTCC